LGITITFIYNISLGARVTRPMALVWETATTTDKAEEKPSNEITKFLLRFLVHFSPLFKAAADQQGPRCIVTTLLHISEMISLKA
jgi:hypothetical protein